MEQDTVRLLRECDAGIKMGVRSIDEVLEYVRAGALQELLTQAKAGHEALRAEAEALLADGGDDGKEPAAMAKGMSWVKTNVKLAMEESDATVADLITDGCNMGVKALARYGNQYPAASEQAKDIARRLIELEERLAVDIRRFL